MKNYKLKAMLLLAVLFSSVSVFAENLLLNDVCYTLNNDGTAQVSSAKDLFYAVMVHFPQTFCTFETDLAQACPLIFSVKTKHSLLFRV